MEKIKERIRILREANGMTCEQFGEKIGVENTIVMKWEKGELLPTLGQIAAICFEFNTNDAWLLCGAGEMDGFSVEAVKKFEAEFSKELDSFIEEGALKQEIMGEPMEVIDNILRRMEEKSGTGNLEDIK